MQRLSLRTAGLTLLVLGLVTVLAGCTPDAEQVGDEEPAGSIPAPSSTTSGTPSSSPTPSPTPSPTDDGQGGPTPTDPATPEPGETESSQPAPEEPAEPDLSEPPTTYEEALAHLDGASGESQEFSRFEAPNTNLYCLIDGDFVPPACELKRGAVTDPKVCPDGPSRKVGRIEMDRTGAQPVCNTDTIREPGAPTLGWGGVATWPTTGVRCVMERLGVTCVDEDAGHAFFLTRGDYAVFAR